MKLNSTYNDKLIVLVQGCRDGNRAHQKGLYELLCGRLFTICLRYSINRAEAEDMLQEGFIKIYSKIDKYDNSGSFQAWASRVVSNNCIDCIRRRPNLYTISDDYVLHRESKEVQIIDKMIGEDLLKMVQELPVGYRTIFNLYVMEGYSHKEIGKKLNISDGTSKSQLNRARKLLQKKVLEHQDYKGIRKTKP